MNTTSTPHSQVFNMDCMDYMKSIPDRFFDLAVVDPPYGLPKDSTHGRGKLKDRILNSGGLEKWDVAPDSEYFRELVRVSKNQIIWGGNYFPLPPTRCVLCWDKVQPWENFSQIELAWTSFSAPAKIFRYDNRTGDKIHPTQKPVALYAWIFQNFARGGQKILDTHLGSGSSRIAAYRMGLDFYACEIDKGYFEASQKRFERECLGVEEINGHIVTQQTLF